VHHPRAAELVGKSLSKDLLDWLVQHVILCSVHYHPNSVPYIIKKNNKEGRSKFGFIFNFNHSDKIVTCDEEGLLDKLRI
jgi:hypothetical protein